LYLLNQPPKEFLGKKTLSVKYYQPKAGKVFWLPHLSKTFRASPISVAITSSHSRLQCQRKLDGHLVLHVRRLRPGIDVATFEKKLQAVVKERVGPEAEKLLGVPIEQFLSGGNTYSFHLQPFTSIYLHSASLE